MAFDPQDFIDADSLDVRGLAKYGIDDCTIPEPTNDQVRRFGRFLNSLGAGDKEAAAARYDEAAQNARAAVEKAAKAKHRKATKEEIDEAVDAAGRELDMSVCQAVAHLCSDTITAAQLEALPPRVYRAFYDWLWGEVMDPHVSRTGTKPSLTALQGGKSAS